MPACGKSTVVAISLPSWVTDRSASWEGGLGYERVALRALAPGG